MRNVFLPHKPYFSCEMRINHVTAAMIGYHLQFITFKNIYSSHIKFLTHRGRNKMADVLLTTFETAFFLYFASIIIIGCFYDGLVSWRKYSTSFIKCFNVTCLRGMGVIEDKYGKREGPKLGSHLFIRLIESIKTTSMEDVSTRVLEKIKHIQEGKTEKWSDVSRHI